MLFSVPTCLKSRLYLWRYVIKYYNGIIWFYICVISIRYFLIMNNVHSLFCSAHKNTEKNSTRHTVEGRVSLYVMTGDRYRGLHSDTHQSTTEQSMSRCCYFCTFQRTKNTFLLSLPNFAFFRRIKSAKFWLKCFQSPHLKHWKISGRGALTCSLMSKWRRAAVYLSVPR